MTGTCYGANGTRTSRPVLRRQARKLNSSFQPVADALKLPPEIMIHEVHVSVRLALLQVLAVIAGVFMTRAVFMMYGYPESELDWNALALLVRNHGFLLLLVPVVWTSARSIWRISGPADGRGSGRFAPGSSCSRPWRFSSFGVTAIPTTGVCGNRIGQFPTRWSRKPFVGAVVRPRSSCL
jgi:hypothetical protein